MIPITGFEKYFITEENGIFRNGKVVKPQLIRSGYLQIRLCRDGIKHGFMVHRLLAIHFIPNPLNLPEVNHDDGNKLNNRLSNLGWCTKAFNVKHAWDNRLIGKTAVRENIKLAHKAICVRVIQADMSGNLVLSHNSVMEAAKFIGRSYTALQDCLNGKQRTCGGFRWFRL